MVLTYPLSLPFRNSTEPRQRGRVIGKRGMSDLETSKIAFVRAFSETSNRDPPHTGFSE